MRSQMSYSFETCDYDFSIDLLSIYNKLLIFLYMVQFSYLNLKRLFCPHLVKTNVII